VLFAALDQAELAAEQHPSEAAVWRLQAKCYWNYVLALRGLPPPVIGRWDPQTGIAWAQTTYCLRRALECTPNDPATLDALYRSYAARHMVDAQLMAGRQLLALGKLAAGLAADTERLTHLLTTLPLAPQSARRSLDTIIRELLQADLPEEAV